jgi:itaconate CoA-transferase
VHWVITEHGRVNLHGLDIVQRARALIGIADPRFRDELTSSAQRLGLLVQP